MRNQRGFSLLELLVAVALMVGLASIALPNYSLYRKKVKATEFLVSLGPYKALLQEWASLSGSDSWPSSQSSFAWPEHSGDLVESISYQRQSNTDTTAIRVIGYLGEGQTDPVELRLLGTIKSDGNVAWVCQASQESQQYFPSSCANS